MPPFSLDELEEAILDASSGLGLGVLLRPEPDSDLSPWANEVAKTLVGDEDGSVVAGQLDLDAALCAAERARLVAWREARARGEGPPSHRVVLRSGASLQIASQTVDFGGQTACLELLVDVGERRRVEEHLSRLESRFQRLLEVAPVAIAIHRSGLLLYGNPALASLLGAGEVSALSLQPLPFSEPFAPPAEPGEPRVVVLRRLDGTQVAVEAVGMTTVWDGERAELFVLRDLEEHERIRRHAAEADRLAAVGQLAAGVAHEINNPLAYLLLNLQYLLRELPRFDGDPQRLANLQERLREARHGAERVSGIVRELREFATPGDTEREPVDLAAVLDGATRLALPQFEGRAHLECRWELAPPVKVLGNTRRLEQVFVNLLVNAAQAGAGKEGAAHRVELVVAGVDGDRVVVLVRDNGVGITPALQRRVFDPFFTTKPVGEGTGLGLPICHGIVTALGGEIRLQSEPGVGTTFSVLLPVASEPSPAPAPGVATEALPPALRPRVLVVDDEFPVASMLGRLLSETCDVELCTSAQAALRSLESGGPWDLVLCDLLMPGMTGMDLFDAVREQGSGLERRMVFMTGGAFTQRVAEFLDSVDNARIEKPFDLKQLVALVQREVERRGRS